MLEKIIFIRHIAEEKDSEIIGDKKLVRMIRLFFLEYIVFDFINEDIRNNLHCSKGHGTNAASIDFIGGERELLKVSDLYINDGSTDVVMSYTLFRKIVTTFMEFDKLYGYYWWTETADRIEIEIDIETDYFVARITPSSVIPKGMSPIRYKMLLKSKK